MDHFRALERMYASGDINRFFRPSIRIESGSAEVRMTVRPDFHHAAHAVHGAAYFKMLDDAAFFAVQSLVTDVFVVTASFSLHLLAPVVNGELVAAGSVVHQSKRLFIADATLAVGDTIVARGTGTFMRSTTRLDDKVGYE